MVFLFYNSENDEQNGEEKPNSFFTAEMCWKLRNAYLHAGSDETTVDHEKRKYSFALYLNAANSYTVNKNNKVTNIKISVNELCRCICDGATLFMKSWENKEDFIEHSCTWIDTKKFHEERSKYNK